MLSELAVGESGVLVALDLPPGVQNHLMYMGFVPDARVRVLHRAPVGDPTVYAVDGMELALRRETAQAIRVQEIKVPAVASEVASLVTVQAAVKGNGQQAAQQTVQPAAQPAEAVHELVR